MPALVLAEVVRPHERFVTKSTHELLDPSVNSLVARQLVAPETDKYIKSIFFDESNSDLAKVAPQLSAGQRKGLSPVWTLT